MNSAIKKQNKIKVSRIIMIVLIIIGSITVIDNTWRLGRELSHAVIRTVSNHRWNTLVYNHE
jgi:hypothetical protein